MGGDQVDSPLDDAPEPLEFDPTGLDLAKRIADAAGRRVLPPVKPGRKPRKRKTGSSDAGSAKGDPVPLGDAMEDLISRRGWGTEINVHLLLGRWPELVGPVVAEHSKPESYRDGVLVIRASSTSWASQLRLMAPQLLAKMNESLGQGTIRLATILGPDAPSWKRGPRSVQGRGPRDTYG